MCGIIGATNPRLLPAEDCLRHRGRDDHDTADRDDVLLKHFLHAVNGHVTQPLQSNPYTFISNCEIYNADSLSKGRNDAASFFNHVQKHGIRQTLHDVDGVHATAIHDEEAKEIVLCRDLLGVKPLWYYNGDNGFAFASERKALRHLDDKQVRELHPRHVIRYDTREGSIQTTYRGFHTLPSSYTDASYDDIVETTADRLETAVLKRVPQDQGLGLLFSGGLDSATIAHILAKNNVDFTAFYGGVNLPGRTAADKERAVRAAKTLNIDLARNEYSKEAVKDILSTLVNTIDDNNFVKISVALPLHIASEQAKEAGTKVLFTGGEAECIFGGRLRHEDAYDVNKDCLSELRRVWYRDLYRDDTVTMHHQQELRVPYLDDDLISYLLTVPHEAKLKSGEKGLLRDVAERLGVPKTIARQPKKSTQYGSDAAKTIKQIANPQSVGEYLAGFDAHNVRLVSLLSSGKDSCLATQRMIEYNYDIRCFATIHSANPDSYMSHTPKTQQAQRIAKKANIPLLEQHSRGEKEDELKDYESVLQRAKQEFGVEGVVTGAIRSEYQRQRIERIADRIGLKTYAPLWRMDEERELRELIRKGFDVEIVDTAAYGLDDSWVGRRLDETLIKDLKGLNDEYGVSLAGEGGEYETLVHDAPFMEEKA